MTVKQIRNALLYFDLLKSFRRLPTRKYSNRVDFGDSSIPTGKVYRKKWAEGISWFWTSIKLIILLAIGPHVVVRDNRNYKSIGLKYSLN